nr:hypothetical protein [Candidatus Sigynarchaeota archaeon]
MAQDTQGEQILDVVKKTLVQFDLLCKDLERAKKLAAGGISKGEISKLQAELAKCQSERQKREGEFGKWENACRDLIQKNADKNKKKIQKIYSKLQEEVAATAEVDKKAQEVQVKLNELTKFAEGSMPSLEALKKQYTTTFEIIQGFRQTIPEIYNRAERETGIYFFTMPK